MPAAVSDSSVEGHDRGDDAVDLLRGLLLIRLDVARWVGANVNVVDHPRQDWVPTMSQATFECELHQLLRRWAHILKALPEGDHGETETFEVLTHLHSTPPVERNLTNIKPLTKGFDEGFDCAVVDDVAFRGL